MAHTQLIFVVLLAAFGFACSEDEKQAPTAKPATAPSNLLRSSWYTPSSSYGIGLGYGGYGLGLGYGGYGAYGGYGGYGGYLPYGYGGILPGYFGGYPAVTSSSVTHHAPTYPQVTSSVTHHAPYGVGVGYLGGLYGGYLGLH
uniref:Suckerin-3 n=1 Tax=Dosidicus gigas TaxID=346249 RepID=A0A081DU70_DOSGI